MGPAVFYVPWVPPELCQTYILWNAPFARWLVAAKSFIFSMNFKGHFQSWCKGCLGLLHIFFFSQQLWVVMQHKTHWKSIGFSCDSALEHFSEVLFPVTTLNYGLEMRGRVGCFITPITGSSGGSERSQFWQNMGLGPVEQCLFELCMADKICESLRAEWSCLELVLLGWPSSSSRWFGKASLSFSCTFGKRNENAPPCSEVLIWIFIKLQLCVFYLSLIHLASWDITVLHSNYCENICILILWGLVSLSRI